MQPLNGPSDSQKQPFNKEDPSFNLEQLAKREMLSQAHHFLNKEFKAYLHRDLLEGNNQSIPAKKEAFFIIRKYLAFGQIFNYIPCKNQFFQGWSRTPLQNNKYFLWWVNSGHPNISHLNLEKDAVVFHSIKRDNDIIALDTLTPNQFILFTAKDFQEKTAFIDPFTIPQREFIDNATPLRILIGPYSSGKTVALLRFLEKQTSGHALFITHSDPFKRMVGKYLQDFSSPNARFSFQSISELCQQYNENTALISERDSLNSFATYIRTECTMRFLDMWAKQPQNLFYEIKDRILLKCAYLNPEDLSNSIVQETYFQSYGDAEEQQVAWKFFARLVADDKIKTIFEYQYAILQLLIKLKNPTNNIIRESFDTLVVDDIQEFSVLELELFLALYDRNKTFSEKVPQLLIARNKESAIRRIGHSFKEMQALITRHQLNFSTFELTQNLRNSKELDGFFLQEYNPKMQINVDTNTNINIYRASQTSIFRLLVNATKELTNILVHIKEITNTANITLISPYVDFSSLIVDGVLKKTVQIPTQIQGLEFQNIVIVDVATLLNLDFKKHAFFAHQKDFKQNLLNQLQLSITRATQRVFFLDLRANADTCKEYQERLGHFKEIDLNFLERECAITTPNFAEQTETLIKEIPNIRQKSVLKAWERIMQIWANITDEDFENDTNIRKIRNRLTEQMLITGIQYFLNCPEKEDAIYRMIENHLAFEKTSLYRDFFKRFFMWYKNQDATPTTFLEETQSFKSFRNEEEEFWINKTLKPFKDSIIKQLRFYAKNDTYAKEFDERLEYWLSLLTLNEEQAKQEAKTLREFAFDTLLQKKNLDAAEKIINTFESVDHVRKGQLFEAQGKYEEAGFSYDIAKELNSAIRAFRMVGNIEKVLSYNQQDKIYHMMTWLKDIQQYPHVTNQQIQSNNYQQLFIFLFEKAKDFVFTKKEKSIIKEVFSALQKNIFENTK